MATVLLMRGRVHATADSGKERVFVPTCFADLLRNLSTSLRQ